MKPVYVLNGPNLGRLGQRDTEIYGSGSYDDLVTACTQSAAQLGLTVDVRQTDDEATLIGWLHEAADAAGAVVLNAAAFTHYSYAVADACADLGIPLVEVHMSNIAAREEFRRTSVIAPLALGSIAGFGVDSYRLALAAIAGLSEAG